MLQKILLIYLKSYLIDASMSCYHFQLLRHTNKNFIECTIWFEIGKETLKNLLHQCYLEISISSVSCKLSLTNSFNFSINSYTMIYKYLCSLFWRGFIMITSATFCFIKWFLYPPYRFHNKEKNEKKKNHYIIPDFAKCSIFLIWKWHKNQSSKVSKISEAPLQVETTFGIFHFGCSMSHNSHASPNIFQVLQGLVSKCTI